MQIFLMQIAQFLAKAQTGTILGSSLTMLMLWLGGGGGVTPALAQPSQEQVGRRALIQNIPIPGPPVALPPAPRPARPPGLTPSPGGSGELPAAGSEALALPIAEPPLGNWGDRADVEPLSLGSLPWLDGAAQRGARYGVWVALPSDRHRQRLQQILSLPPASPGSISGLWQPAGDFAEPQGAEALARALQRYGFGVQVQRH